MQRELGFLGTTGVDRLAGVSCEDERQCLQCLIRTIENEETKPRLQ